MTGQKVTIWNLEEDVALAKAVKNMPRLLLTRAYCSKQKEGWTQVATSLKLQKNGNECSKRFRILHSKYIVHHRNGTLESFPQASAMSFLKHTIKPLRLTNPRLRISPPSTEMTEDTVKVKIEVDSPPSLPTRPTGRPKKLVGPRSGLIKFPFPKAKTKRADTEDVKPSTSTAKLSRSSKFISYPKTKRTATAPVFTDMNGNGNHSTHGLGGNRGKKVPGRPGRPKIVNPLPLFTATCIPPPPPPAPPKEETGQRRPLHGSLRGPNFLFSQYVASILDTFPDDESLAVRNKIHEVLHEAQSEYLKGRPDKMTYLNNHTGGLFEIECGNCLKVNLVQGNPSS